MLPDDVAQIIVQAVAADCQVRISQVLSGDASDLTSWVVEVVKSTSTRAMACVNHQFARLTRPVTRAIGQRAYHVASYGPEHVVFVEIRN